MSSVSPTNQDLSNDTTFSQIISRVPVPLSSRQKRPVVGCSFDWLIYPWTSISQHGLWFSIIFNYL